MSIFIKRSKTWLERYPKTKQWLWFAALWCSALFAVIATTYQIKLLVKIAS